RVGSSPGFHEALGRVTIAYIDPDNPDNFYIEYEGVKPHLFLVRKSYIAHKVYGSRVFDLYRATVGSIYIAQALLLMMGFMPAFIEGGFAVLINEILISYASSKLEEQAERIHPIFGKLVGLAALALAPRPRFKTPVKGLARDQEVSVLSSAD